MKPNWIRHDTNSLRNPAISRLVATHGWQSYGLYMALLDTLANHPGNRYPLEDLPLLAYELRVPVEVLEPIIHDVDLFHVSGPVPGHTLADDQKPGGYFWSEDILQQANAARSLSETRKKAALRRWRSTPMNEPAMHLHEKTMHLHNQPDAFAYPNDAFASQTDAFASPNDAFASPNNAFASPDPCICIPEPMHLHAKTDANACKTPSKIFDEKEIRKEKEEKTEKEEISPHTPLLEEKDKKEVKRKEQRTGATENFRDAQIPDRFLLKGGILERSETSRGDKQVPCLENLEHASILGLQAKALQPGFFDDKCLVINKKENISLEKEKTSAQKEKVAASLNALELACRPTGNSLFMRLKQAFLDYYTRQTEVAYC